MIHKGGVHDPCIFVGENTITPTRGVIAIKETAVDRQRGRGIDCTAVTVLCFISFKSRVVNIQNSGHINSSAVMIGCVTVKIRVRNSGCICGINRTTGNFVWPCCQSGRKRCAVVDKFRVFYLQYAFTVNCSPETILVIDSPHLLVVNKGHIVNCQF